MGSANAAPVDLTPQQALFLRQRKRGRSVTRAAAKAGVCRATGYNWDRQLRELGILRIYRAN